MYIVHHFSSTELCCAPSTFILAPPSCIVHHDHQGNLIFLEVGGTPTIIAIFQVSSQQTYSGGAQGCGHRIQSFGGSQHTYKST